ncbi:MAG: tRNA (adenosine(37)-N6)-dimethylallyltransferase MiaA [Firmicutes bacterium]|nr:tRNA (adenosine(37)-N6)-dimethylallyltransferase MiaA [Bacillota bacterium]
MENTENIREIGICGATATGKSELAVLLAEKFGGEIVSCDSMQIYRGMDIGTAKPSREMLLRVPHHMIGTVDTDTAYSCAKYAEEAKAVIEEIKARGNVPIVCGGTGLYLETLYYRNRFCEEELPAAPSVIRDSLLRFARETKNGSRLLYEKLCEIDPGAAAGINPENTRRVARAIEIYETTGITKTEWDKKSRDGEHADMTIIMLRYASRTNQQKAIKMRCRKMLDDGLEAEARALYESGALTNGTTASQAIGYKEFIPYFNGTESLRAAQDRFFTATCRYAKRQETWFRHKDYVNTIYVDDVLLGNKTMADIADEASELYLSGASGTSDAAGSSDAVRSADEEK